MSDSGKYVRSGSGLWRLVEEPEKPAPKPAEPPKVTPQRFLTPTPARGLPLEPKARALQLTEQARAQLLKGQFTAAEASYRLALTFDPGNATLALELKGAVEARERARREADDAKKKPPPLR